MNRNWRDGILSEFVPKISRLTIVSDPDALLTEEKLVVTLRTRGFDIIEFSDAIEFRYAYESNYRTAWDKGEHTDLVVVLRLQNSELDNLPFDLLRTGRKLSFDLGSLFPNLSYPVIEKLDRSLLDALFDAQQNYSPGRLGDNATKDFILSYVFGIAAELIRNEIELLRVLLRIHYNSLNIPPDLAIRLIQVLDGSQALGEWPLIEIISDEKAFFSFLQERWPVFLSNFPTSDKIGEESKDYGLKYRGPNLLPFDHQNIRVYIDNLFVEGKLTPVDVGDIDMDTLDSSPWMKCGVIDPGKNRDVRITRLFDLIEKEKPTVEFRYSEWISFAQKWSELAALIHTESTIELKQRFFQLGDSFNQTFLEWLTHHYAGLINLPPINPVMLHHIARGMSRALENSESVGMALIVVDGLSLDQWIPLKQAIQEQTTNTLLRESAVFAWVPTLTSVSRQSIFAGKAPLYFPHSINTTQNEPVLWRQFWESNGLSRPDIAYKRGLGDGDPIAELESV
ncbi:MAG: BREX-3 system phosphatase PglZ, partial [SAR324 cluster bacterium]|nr:BREX-3 system phosphatase PglZ [SAR324 cluster bacterium]